MLSQSPNSQTPDLKNRVRSYYQRLVSAERPWLRSLLNTLMGETSDTVAEVDMARLITCSTAYVYYLILSDAPPPLIAPVNGHVGRIVTLQAYPPVATDLIYLIYLILRNPCDTSSDDDSIPECVRHMYT